MSNLSSVLANNTQNTALATQPYVTSAVNQSGALAGMRNRIIIQLGFTWVDELVVI